MNNPLTDFKIYQLGCKKRVEYFIQLSPEGLSIRETTYGELPISCFECERRKVEEINNRNPATDIFELVLRAGIEHSYHVFKFTPKIADDVINLYPWATEAPISHKNVNGDDGTFGYFPDHLTIGLQKGVIFSSSNFEKVYNLQVLDVKDPVTGLYLFMIAASDICADKTSSATMSVQVIENVSICDPRVRSSLNCE